jgi:hypothetical protein
VLEKEGLLLEEPLLPGGAHPSFEERLLLEHLLPKQVLQEEGLLLQEGLRGAAAAGGSPRRDAAVTAA